MMASAHSPDFFLGWQENSSADQANVSLGSVLEVYDLIQDLPLETLILLNSYYADTEQMFANDIVPQKQTVPLWHC